jgi:hypothetical protein
MHHVHLLGEGGRKRRPVGCIPSRVQMEHPGVPPGHNQASALLARATQGIEWGVHRPDDPLISARSEEA